MKRFTTEQVIHKLRKAEVEQAKGRTIVGISERLGRCRSGVHDGYDPVPPI